MTDKPKPKKRNQHIKELYQRSNDLAGAVLELQAFCENLSARLKQFEDAITKEYEKNKKKSEKLIVTPEDL